MTTDENLTKRAKDGKANELPLHGVSHARPAEAFMAEQAALVDPRRAAFARLSLAPEHVANLPEALRLSGRDESPSPRPAPGVRFDVVDERPALEYELPRLRVETSLPARLLAQKEGDEEG